MTIETLEGKPELDIESLVEELGKEEPGEDKDEEAINLSNKPKTEKVDSDESEEDEASDEAEGEDEKPEPKSKLKLDDKSDEEEIDEDELEYHEVPERQKILKDYPDIFKKHPALERAIYRERAYTDVFATIKDAKEAASSIKQFTELQNDLLSGNLTNLLSSVKKADEKAFEKITESYLETLFTVDKTAYTGVAETIVRATLANVFNNVKDARKDSAEEQVKIAVQLLNKALFNSTEVKGPESKVKTEDRETEAAKKLAKERDEFETNRFSSALNEVEERVSSKIKSAVEQHIDTKNLMTPYVKSKAIEDTVNEVFKQVSSDSRFKGLLGRMWKEAKEAGYTTESKAKIRQTVLKKVETILPGIMQKVKGDALKGHATRTRTASESRDEKPVSSGRPAKPSNKDNTVPKNMSTLDYLSS